MSVLKFTSPIKLSTLHKDALRDKTIKGIRYESKKKMISDLDIARERLVIKSKSTTSKKEINKLNKEYNTLSTSILELQYESELEFKAEKIAKSLSVSFTSLKESLGKLKDIILEDNDKEEDNKDNLFLTKDINGNWYRNFD